MFVIVEESFRSVAEWMTRQVWWVVGVAVRCSLKWVSLACIVLVKAVVPVQNFRGHILTFKKQI